MQVSIQAGGSALNPVPGTHGMSMALFPYISNSLAAAKRLERELPVPNQTTILSEILSIAKLSALPGLALCEGMLLLQEGKVITSIGACGNMGSNNNFKSILDIATLSGVTPNSSDLVIAGGNANSTTLLVSELVISFKVLRDGGTLIVKLEDTFTPIVISLIYLIAASFEQSMIIKPKSSDNRRSDRYLVAQGLIKRAELTRWYDLPIEQYTITSFNRWYEDKAFVSSIRSSIDDIGFAQVDALQRDAKTSAGKS